MVIFHSYVKLPEGIFHCIVNGYPEAITGFMTALQHTVPWGVLLITVWFAERQGDGHRLTPASSITWL
jgi:hypothetical protein